MTEQEKEALKQGQTAQSTKPEKESTAITPEKLQSETRLQMQSASKAIANELTSPFAQMVSDQLAVNVLTKLPDIAKVSGETLKDFLNGALNTEVLMGASPMAPYLKMAGISEE